MCASFPRNEFRFCGLACFALILFFAQVAQGTVSVSASGAQTLTADTRTGGSLAAYTSVSTTNPAITEGATGEIGTNIVITAPTNWTFNTAQAVTATVTGGNLTLTSATATPTASTITFTVNTASNNTPSTVTFTNLQIRPANCTGATIGTANITVTTDANAGAEDLNAATLAVMTVTPGTAYQLAFTTQPVSTMAAADLTLAVAVQDACGNTVTSDTRSITLEIGANAGSTGTLGGVKTVACSSGVASWTAAHDLNIDKVGTGYTLKASHSGSALAGSSQTVTSSAFNITRGTAYKLAFTTQPLNTVAGQNLVPGVTIQDAGGNTVSDDTRTITLAILNNPSVGSAVLSGSTSVTTVNGVATWRSSESLRIDVAGVGYTLYASHSGANFTGSDTVISNTFNIIPAAADHLGFVTQPVDTPAGSPLYPVVAVQDALGNTITDDTRTITLAISDDPSNGVATLGGTKTHACVSGLATWVEADGLNIDVSTSGFTLVASHGGANLAGSQTAVSESFDTTAKQQAVGNDGSVDLSNEYVSLSVEGAGSGSGVLLDTDLDGDTVCTLANSNGNTVVDLFISGLENDGGIDLAIDSNGKQSFVFAGSNGVAVFSMDLVGVGTNGSIAVAIDEQGDQQVVITNSAGIETTFDFNSIPAAATVILDFTVAGGLFIEVIDAAGKSGDLSIEVSGTGDGTTFAITYNDRDSAKIVTDLPGFEGEISVGGSVTVAGDNLSDDAQATVALTYLDSDLSGIAESSLRLQKRDKNTGIYVAAGTNDVGQKAPTGITGDYGIETDKNSTWAEVDEFGTFAVGIPQIIDPETKTGCGSGASPCGAAGVLSWSVMLLGLAAMKRKQR